MSELENMKNRLQRHRGSSIVKPCPICGYTPALDKVSLDHGNGHGYPGNYSYQFRCCKCGLIKTDITTDIYDNEEELTAIERIVKEWNEIVDYINELIDKTRNNE